MVIVYETLTLGTVFIGGFLSFMSPCILPLLPVYFSTFAKGTIAENPNDTIRRRIQVVLKSFIFVLGVSTTFIILGFGAGQFSSILNNPYFLKVMGFIVIVLGIHQTGLINFKFLNYEKKVNLSTNSKNDYFSTYLLGLTFSFGWTPCIGPILTAVLSIAASGNNIVYGGALMAIYSLGFALPFVIISFFTDILLKKMKGFNKHLNTIKIIGGIVIIFMGILLMSDNLYFITSLFER